MTRSGALSLKALAARRPGWRDERGSPLLEFALLAPVLIMMMLGVADLGRIAWVQATLDYAAGAAARCAAVDTTNCATTAQVQTYAVSRAYGMSLGASVFTVAQLPCGRQVSASTPVDVLTPWLSTGGLTVKANACFPAPPAT